MAAPAAHILIVDDEPNMCKTLSLILQQAGYQVSAAGHAREARQYLQAGSYDLAFFDIKMPEVDGLTLLQEVHERYPQMPVLILTAHGALDSAMAAIRHGARDYLLKPIAPAALLVRVREVLAEQQAPRRQREITTQIKALIAEMEQEAPSGELRPATLATIDPARYLERGPLCLDLFTHRVQLNSQPISVPPSAFNYLATLMRYSPEPVSYKALVKEAQGYDLSLTEARELAHGQVYELRKALESDLRHPRYIITVRNVGYRLVL